MARKHPPSTMLNRSSLVGIVEFSARKLIIFVLVQLVLSPFVLITVDSLNGSQNSSEASALDLKHNYDGSASNTSVKVNNLKTKCTGDGVLTSAPPTNVSLEKNTSGNSISMPIQSGVNRDRPYDGNLSLTRNASIHNQSRQTITPTKDLERLKHETGNFNKDGERVLSRKRRYLIFPPGSSMQIVYDTYHPIVDYSNYLILGITAAMAWELPSTPIYLDQELREKYEMGELPLLQRNDKNVTNAQYVLPLNNSPSTMNSIDSNSYYTNIPKKKFTSEKYQYKSPYKSNYQSDAQPSYSMTNESTDKFQQYVSYADSLMKQFKQLTDRVPQDRPLNSKDFQEFTNILAKTVKTAPKSNPKYSIKRKNYKHFIHPAFKKRSIDELTPLDKFDLNLHRNSRHALYKQINTFLKTQGSDGNECILKMLCETGQRRRNKEPGSMVIELLRAVFTIPEPTEPAAKFEHRMYDEAHASMADCQQQYPKCKESVWNSKYM